jgi:cytochrome c-type biogenesis protein CcmF
VGPQLQWKRGDLAGALGRLWLAMLAAGAAALLALWLAGFEPSLALLGVAIAGWLFAATLTELAERIGLRRQPRAAWRKLRQLPRASLGMTLAHAGLAVAILGMTGASAWKEEQVANLAPGGTLAAGFYDYRLERVDRIEGPNYWAYRAQFTVTRDGATVALLAPERRFYMVQRMPTTEAAIHTNGLADLYAVIGDPDGKGGWTVRIYREPLVPLIWGGILVMVLGGLVSLSDRCYRVGAPAPARPGRLAATQGR